MRVAVECKSPLMQKSLELFLKNYLSSIKHCDVILRDEPCLENEKCFYISSSKDADLVKPFSKSQLILALENRCKSITKDTAKEEGIFLHEDPLNFDILEKRIDSLTKEYQENILKAVRAFYEK